MLDARNDSDRQPRSRTRFRLSIALWIGLLALSQAADWLTTRVSVDNGSIEVNPLAAYFLQRHTFWLVKLLVVAAVVLLVLYVSRRMSRLGPRTARARRALYWAMAASVALATIASIGNAVMIMLAVRS